MPILNDHSDLPAASNRDAEGWAPDPEPIFGPLLIESLRLTKGQRLDKERHYVRPSDSLKCSRALSYIAAGAPSEPMDPSGWWVTSLGTFIHELVGPAVEDFFGPEHVTVEHEIGDPIYDDEGNRAGVRPHVVEVRGVSVPIVSYIDLWVHSPKLSLVTDFKSKGGYAYKLAVGERGAPEGPSRSELIQSGIGALIVGAENVSVTYFAKEAISKAVANRKGFDDWRRFTAEWTVPLDEIRTEVEDELLRMAAINRMWHEEQTLAKRVIPGLPAEIADPTKGSWEQYGTTENGESYLVNTGSAWNCSYCPWQTLCAEHGPGRVANVNISTNRTETP